MYVSGHWMAVTASINAFRGMRQSDALLQVLVESSNLGKSRLAAAALAQLGEVTKKSRTH